MVVLSSCIAGVLTASPRSQGLLLWDLRMLWRKSGVRAPSSGIQIQLSFLFISVFSCLRTKFDAEGLNVMFHTWNSEADGFILHLIFLCRRGPGHFFSTGHLIFRVDLLPPPHSLLEISASIISKHFTNETMIHSLNIPNELRPLICACCKWLPEHALP